MGTFLQTHHHAQAVCSFFVYQEESLFLRKKETDNSICGKYTDSRGVHCAHTCTRVSSKSVYGFQCVCVCGGGGGGGGMCVRVCVCVCGVCVCVCVCV